MLVGDFNLPTEKLGNLLSKFNRWRILTLWGGLLNFMELRGNRESDIDYAIINDHIVRFTFIWYF